MRLLQIDFGERLDKGLETVVGRNGVKLSGGQAQRLMIGAAAMKRPLFMVIDEATSSLDSSTEKLVQHGLAQVLSGNVSALVIAHRLSTVRHLCDRFIVLRDTAALQNGDSQVEAIAASFEELYAISPTFRRLADDQGIVI
jgi:ABC-type multidrug transport system fused ATPase/permease subunit